jgi:hypothetical protein
MKISPGKRLREFGATLLLIKNLFAQLTSMFTITEQELMDAGVYLHEHPRSH